MKAIYIDQWCVKNHVDITQCLIIDDSKEVLNYCYAYDMQTKYPQQLICDYEEHLNQLHMDVVELAGSRIAKLERGNGIHKCS